MIKRRSRLFLASSLQGEVVKGNATTRYAYATLAGLLLAGCATVSGLSTKEPDLVMTSAKSPHDLAACIAASWGHHHGGANTNLLENGFVVSIPNQVAGTDAEATITSERVGSHVSFSERMPSLSPAWMKASVVQCR